MNPGIKFSIGVGLLLALLFVGFWGLEQPYTARIVDAETGEPIEGAVYLAAWYRTTWLEKAWFEGPSTVMSHYREGYSDENGEIYVPGFWFKIPFWGRERTLTVYKAGYAMWNQEFVFPDRSRRKDFSLTKRTARMGKWQDEFLYGDHYMFLIPAFRGNYRDEKYKAGEQIFYKAHLKHEEALFRNERFNAYEENSK